MPFRVTQKFSALIYARILKKGRFGGVGLASVTQHTPRAKDALIGGVYWQERQGKSAACARLAEYSTHGGLSQCGPTHTQAFGECVYIEKRVC